MLEEIVGDVFDGILRFVLLLCEGGECLEY
jgi:hypothetical protein